MTLAGPGRIDDISLDNYRPERRLQELVFDLARALTRGYVRQSQCEAPPQVLFPQLVAIVERYLNEKVHVFRPSDIKDLFLEEIRDLLASVAKG